eukprot:3789292-Pleurochrysis_carterae.AAC.1
MYCARLQVYRGSLYITDYAAIFFGAQRRAWPDSPSRNLKRKILHWSIPAARTHAAVLWTVF